MQKLNSLLLIVGLLLVALATLSRGSVAQSKPQLATPVDLEALLTEAGYKPVKARDGLWGITVSSNQSKYLKASTAFVEINPYTRNLRISVRIGIHDHLNENAELNEKVNDLAKRLKPTEFSLAKTTLYAIVEVSSDNLDKIALTQAIHKAVEEGDRAYPELAKFIKLEAPESTGPGYGTGIGTGGGVGPGPAHESKTSQESASTKPVEVDSKPVMLTRVRPAYTPEARANNVQGTVTLRLVVDENGDAKQIRVVRGLPDGLTEQAIEAARKTKFKPAMKDGKPVSYSIALEISFNLK